jgi:DNA-binding Lrp family transcriptional regulator
VSDLTEKRILNALYGNSHRSRKLIAKEVGLSEPSLSKKIATLEHDGVIKNFSINVDYERAGYNTDSVTLIRLNDQHKDKQTAIVEKLAKINEAVEVYTVLGSWDIYVRWICKSNGQVMELVQQHIVGIGQTETLTLGEKYKRENGPLLEIK